jgi:hypothetical protein
MSTTKTPPVLFLVFNRPETTRQVLDAIRRAAPERLYVAADGPREGKPGDSSACDEVRRQIRDGIDWNCRTQYLMRDRNLGCRRAVSSALSWFFEQVEEGVVLEDDCLPDPRFFPFCAELLERYRQEPRVAHIGGFNCQFGRKRGEASYYFSRYFHVWGWATWRRAWQGYDVAMSDYPEFLREGGLSSLFDRVSIRDFWKDNFDATYEGRVDTWDYQWVYTNFKHDRLSIVPNWNMVENIGFGAGATHTSGATRRPPPVTPGCSGPLIHPLFVLPHRGADDFTYRHELNMGRFHDVKNSVKRLLRREKRSQTEHKMPS